jgi:protein pelota
MKIIKFYESSGTLKVKLDTVEDLWCIERIVFKGDMVKSESKRRFRSVDTDAGELKDVVIKIAVEGTELDKAAMRLRISGKILEGKPMEYIRLNSYHTLNISVEDIIEITKEEWPDYIVQVVKNSVKDSKKPRLGIIAMDDEKALLAYLHGSGIQFENEIYSHLSKRMSQKEFTEQQNKYFNQILDFAGRMPVEIIVIAGPGFTKDDIKKYAEANGILKKIGKRFFFFKTSNNERSGIYELIRGKEIAEILEGDRMREEFALMAEFLEGLESGRSKSGINAVIDAINNYDADRVLVNDSVLADEVIKNALSKAEAARIKINIINSDDEVGMQLHSFGDIACL